MRLIKVKLSGFKSFVDPTTILFPGNLLGVVGPNGCGKSNIIDAIRWVLGESKADELRGESIQDVIFKGSNTRKEVGRASVELHFDNQRGLASGQWSVYNELLVKRVLDRSGVSVFSINGQKVRKKDVTSLFLGTGVGPRAYAIISQGMISNVIEANPQQLKLFIEEVAGVSRYKVKRKETEGRLSDAKENLDRVEDIQGELKKQVDRLRQQADTARHFEDIRTKRAENLHILWFKKQAHLNEEITHLETTLLGKTNETESLVSQVRLLERSIDQQKEIVQSSLDQLEHAQRKFSSSSMKIKQLEQKIAYLFEKRSKLDQNVSEAKADLTHWQQETGALEEKKRQLLLERLSAEEEHQQLDQIHQEQIELLELAKNESRQTHQKHASLERDQQSISHQIQLLESEQSHLRSRLGDLTDQIASMANSQKSFPAFDEDQLLAHKNGLADLNEEQSQLESVQDTLTKDHEACLSLVDEHEQCLSESAQELTKKQARLVAIQSILERSTNQDMANWLSQLDFEVHIAPLWKSIDVRPGWEKAVESVLQYRLKAILLSSNFINQPMSDFGVPPENFAAAWLLPDDEQKPSSIEHNQNINGLLSQIHCLDERWQPYLNAFLGFIQLSESNEEARQKALTEKAWVVSKSGCFFSPYGMEFYSSDSSTTNLLEHHREARELTEEVRVLQATYDDQLTYSGNLKKNLDQCTHSLEENATALLRNRELKHNKMILLSGLEQRKKHIFEKQQALFDQIHLLEEKKKEIQLLFPDKASRLENLFDQKEEIDSVLNQHVSLKNQADEKLLKVTEEADEKQRQLQANLMRLKEIEIHISQNERAYQQSQKQCVRLNTLLDNLSQQYIDMENIDHQSQLDDLIQKRDKDEKISTQARLAVEESQQVLKDQEIKIRKFEKQRSQCLDEMTQIKLALQKKSLERESIEEKRAEEDTLSNAQKEALFSQDDINNSISKLEQNIKELSEQLLEFDAVNHAAAKELAQVDERLGYLNRQATDLEMAIEKLSQVIIEIDQETNEKMDTVFTVVNQNFCTLFPSLFGGGQAGLSLTNDNLLEAGVQIMAQPPGKKNSTIHLLSGGEKALTAIAFIFSLFEVNPAPFCLLDEVDAPLDDRNVERYCKLVKEMSKKTQFVFITHNRISMEMSEQLVGVTMQEAGISKVVEVDVGEALSLSSQEERA